jgi:hypothetical protein
MNQNTNHHHIQFVVTLGTGSGSGVCGGKAFIRPHHCNNRLLSSSSIASLQSSIGVLRPENALYRASLITPSLPPYPLSLDPYYTLSTPLLPPYYSGIFTIAIDGCSQVHQSPLYNPLSSLSVYISHKICGNRYSHNNLYLCIYKCV